MHDACGLVRPDFLQQCPLNCIRGTWAEIWPIGMCIYYFLFVFNRRFKGCNRTDGSTVLVGCLLFRSNGLCLLFFNLLSGALFPLCLPYNVARVRIGIGVASDYWHDGLV